MAVAPYYAGLWLHSGDQEGDMTTECGSLPGAPPSYWFVAGRRGPGTGNHSNSHLLARRSARSGRPHTEAHEVLLWTAGNSREHSLA